MGETARTVEVVGREQELVAVTEFLDAPDRLPSILLIRGEAGIGKTTIWEQALAEARERSFRVLSHRGSAAEVQLSYAALGDLLRDVADEALAGLPGPQRRGLEVALTLAEAGERPPAPQAIAAGFLQALSKLADGGPLLVAIDDIQWLDPSSATTLAFALRRLRREPICVVLAQRVENGRQPAFGSEQGLQGAVVHELEVRPLSLGALHHLVTARIGATFARPTLLRLYEISGGNPFFALELARAFVARGSRFEPGEPWPLPTDLHELLRDRLAALPAPTRSALLTVATLSQPTFALVEEALNVDAEVVLTPAVDAQVIGLDGDTIRFTHPLLAAAVQAGARPAAQRGCHRRLAEVVEGHEERARHLALATTGEDREVADDLDDAAHEARRRGAPAAAAELMEHAARLTPSADGAARRRRRTEAGMATFEAGDLARARSLLEAVVADAPAGPERTDALVQLGTVLESGDYNAALELFEQAEREARDDDGTRARVLCRLGGMMYFHLTDVETVERRIRTAVELAEAAGDEETLAQALGRLGSITFFRGRGLPRELLERAAALEARTGRVHVEEDGGPTVIYAELLLEVGELEPARELLVDLCDLARAAGDAGLAYPLFLLSWVDFEAGRWPAAEAGAREALDLAAQTGRETLEVLALSALGLVEGGLGQASSARAHLEDAIAIAERLGRGGRVPRWALGRLELSLGDYAAAWGCLEAAVENIVGIGIEGPHGQVADGIEALAGQGRVEEARELLVPFEAAARKLGWTWSLAAGARCHAVVAAAEGDLEPAQAAAVEAVRLGEQAGQPLELGRSLLVLGQVQRRLKQKRSSRETLERARSTFEELGAKLWAERSGAELARIGGRSAADGLTPTERRVAELVAEGRSNKEVAAALYVTVKSVEANLSRVYAKLGLRSRTELAAKLKL